MDLRGTTGWTGPAAKPILNPQPPDHEECFAHDGPRHLGAALKPVREDDGHFGDAHALSPNLVGHLDLKAVAIGAHGIDVDALKRPPAKTLVASGRIGDGHAGDHS